MDRDGDRALLRGADGLIMQLRFSSSARLLLLACAALGGGCCHAPSASNVPTLVAVREAVVRTPTFALPLDDASRESLRLFLAAGGNNDGVEDGALVTVVYPDADARWGALLLQLSRPENTDIADLTNGSYAKWFKGSANRQVVDAREARPTLACPPFAFSQDRFVWIFSCKGTDKLGGLFVQQAIAPRSDQP